MNTIYKDDLAKEIGGKIGKPATKTKLLIKYFEEIIASELKSKDRVKLQNFGTFYLIHQKSRHIIQIRTKQRRILIGTTLIKFRPSLKVKHKLNVKDEEEVLKIVTGPAPKPIILDTAPPQVIPIVRIEQPAEKEPEEETKIEEIPITKPETKSVEVEVKVAPPEPEIEEVEPVAPKAEKPEPIGIKVQEIPVIKPPQKTVETETQSQPIKTAPIPKAEIPEAKKYERVDADKIRADIAKRVQAMHISSRNSDELLFKHHILEHSAGGKLFALAFKRIELLGQKSLGFYLLDDKKSCQIYFGKPRKKLAEIPKQNAIEFLSSHLEIDTFDFPQERFVKLYTSSRMDIGWIVFAHTLPLAEGTSVYVKLVKEL